MKRLSQYVTKASMNISVVEEEEKVVNISRKENRF